MDKTAIAGLLCVVACAGSSEAPVVELPVEVAAAGVVAVTNDLGYTITISAMRTALRDIEFTILGETHESLLRESALAHPGHSAGGDVTGELVGELVVDWLADGAALGTATLIVGDYQGANFTFRRASAASDGLAPDDVLVGHTMTMAGNASGAVTVDFTAVIDIDEDTPMVGAPFAQVVTESAPAKLALGLLTIDPSEGDSLFDGIDFALADDDDDGVVAIVPGQDIHNILKRNVQVHDHYTVTAE